jgi:hypothetical protein
MDTAVTKRAIVFATELQNAKLIVDPDDGHGFLFQYPSDFAPELNQFLQTK